MLKTLITVALSVFLSISAILGFGMWHKSAKEDLTQLRVSTVYILNGSASCSGAVVAKNRVLTAAHCLQYPNEKTVINGFTAKVLKRDVDVDLMLLEVETPDSGVPVANKTPAYDTKAYTVGFPLGDQVGQRVVTDGRVQSKYPMSKPYDLTPFMLVTAPVIYGNSGGGVYAFVEGSWKLVGIVSGMQGTAIMGMYPFLVTHLTVVSHTETLNKFLNAK